MSSGYPYNFVGPFICCTCPAPDDYDPSVDPPLDVYIHKCQCPTVEVECESSLKSLELCGTLDPDGPAGTYYKTKISTGEVNRYLNGPEIKTTTYVRNGASCTNSSSTQGDENCSGYSSSGTYYNKQILTYTLNQGSVTGNCGGTITASGTAVETRQKVQDSSGCSFSVVSRTTPSVDVTIGPGS